MQRNPNTIGHIYRIPDEENSDPAMFGNDHSRPSSPGCFYMPIEHTGDCHYTWLRLVEKVGNDTTRYFDAVRMFNGYSTSEDYIITDEPFTTEQVLKGVIAMSYDGRASFLIPRNIQEERAKQPVSERILDYLRENGGIVATTGDTMRNALVAEGLLVE